MAALSQNRNAQAPQRDLEYSVADFNRIAGVLRNIAGIRMPGSNEALVFSRLSRRVRELGLSRFCDYIDFIQKRENHSECEAMVAALTTNTTRFFREDYHFDTFVKVQLPALAHSAQQGGRVRLWSAGCSTGEEPYSLAAVVLKHFPDAPRFDFKILATDINRQVLNTAQLGRYAKSSAMGVDAEYYSLMFENASDDGDAVDIRPKLKELVTFRYMNFMEPWPVKGPFAAIFCRNVMIYMEETTQAQIWAGLEVVLAKDGYLFIGHSERIGPEFRDRLELVGNTTFRHI